MILNKGNSCEIEIFIYFDAMLEMVCFFNISLYCKIIISFLEFFSVVCFLCTLQTQLTRRNTSIPKFIKQRHHMTFLRAPSYDKSDICQIFYQDLLHIVNSVYMQNFM